MLQLSNITLLSVSSVEQEGTDLALRISSHDINFGAIKFLSSEEWISTDPRIEVIPIPRINFDGYSKFILEELVHYVETEFCLIVQADGFVLNASRWNPRFLDYDYIGAPWPRNLMLQMPPELRGVMGDVDLALDLRRNQIGNGGFSLRSKKLLQETSKIAFDELSFLSKSEDLIIGYYLYDQMLAAGIKFPEPELAAQFSIESLTAAYGQNPKTSFGFHSKTLRDLIFGGNLS
jgi:hypothetical protein